MKIKENAGVTELVWHLFKLTDSWDMQEVWLSHVDDKSRDEPKYKNKWDVYKMRDNGLININKEEDLVSKGKFIFETDITKYHCFNITFERTKLLDYLIKLRPLRWGKLTINTDDTIEFDGVRRKELYTSSNKARRLVKYLIFLKYVSFYELGKILDITTSGEQTIEERIRKLKLSAKNELVGVKFKIPRKYAEKMLRSERGQGYSLEEFSNIDRM
jgi:hypothetical protein